MEDLILFSSDGMSDIMSESAICDVNRLGFPDQLCRPFGLTYRMLHKSTNNQTGEKIFKTNSTHLVICRYVRHTLE